MYVRRKSNDTRSEWGGHLRALSRTIEKRINSTTSSTCPSDVGVTIACEAKCWRRVAKATCKAKKSTLVGKQHGRLFDKKWRRLEVNDRGGGREALCRVHGESFAGVGWCADAVKARHLRFWGRISKKGGSIQQRTNKCKRSVSNNETTDSSAYV